MVADSLDIFIQGTRVGALTSLGGDRSILSFADAYVADPNRPTLSLSFKDARGDLIIDHPPVQTRVQTFFSNLLPEGGMRDYLAGRAGVKPMRDYALLEVLGADLPGAVELRPSGAGRRDDEAASLVTALTDPESPFRFSLAGVQLKFSALAREHGGLTIPAGGAGGDWIVKLPSPRWRGVAENEFSMMTLAAAVGLDVPEVRLTPLAALDGLPDDVVRGEGAAFAVRRFDRRAEGGKVHIEDFAQIFGVYPEEKYAKARYRSIARVLWLEAGEAAVREFVARLVFNTLIGNADMHLKNWSVIYPDGRTPALAPGYDFLSTTPYLPDENMALRFETGRRMTDLSLDELSRLAARAEIPPALVYDSARATVDRFQTVWAAEAAHLPMHGDVRAEVDRLLRSIPLVQGR